jgi:TolB-like protein/Flp pilus assembly protein TadD
VTLLAELKRRNVFRMAVLYVVGSWLNLQMGDLLFDLMGLPDWSLRIVLGILILGFPVALVVSWMYELTPEGVKREHDVDRSESITPRTGQRLNIITLIVALIAIVLVAFQHYVEPDSAETPAPIQAASPTIAVLPFVNMSSNPEQEFFSDGMTEEILNVLAKIDGLQVTGRTSSFQFKGQNLDLRDIGQRLGVAHVLEGSVRRFGDDLRITAQLVRADNGFHLWSESYDRKMANVFAIQEEIAKAIAQALTIPLGLEVSGTIRAVQTENIQAYEIYLRGLTEVKRRGPGVQRAVDQMRHAVELDPNFSAAWGALAFAYAIVPYHTGDQVNEAVWVENAELAIDAAERALALDDQAVTAHVALGLAFWSQRQWLNAEAAFRRAIELDPRDANAHQQYAEFLNEAGFYQRAFEHARRAAELDPLTPIVLNALGYIAINYGEFDVALEALRSAISLNPELGSPYRNLTSLALVSGRDDALDLLLGSLDGIDQPDRGRKVLSSIAGSVLGSSHLDTARTAMIEDGYWEFAAYLGVPELWFEDELAHHHEQGWPSVFSSLLPNEILVDPRLRDIIVAEGLPEFWDQAGWPPICRRIGDDDFVCGGEE